METDKSEGESCSVKSNLPNSGIKPGSPALWVDSLPSEPPGRQIIWVQIMAIAALSI